MSHPTLETERLVLRPWRPAADLDALAAVNADAAVMRHVAPRRPLTRAETAEQLDGFVRHWEEHGFGLWAVVPRDGDGRAIGFAGLAVPSFLPQILPAVEVGWRLAPAWWGRGLATEAAGAAVAFGFQRLACGRSSRPSSRATTGRCGLRRSSACARRPIACIR